MKKQKKPQKKEKKRKYSYCHSHTHSHSHSYSYLFILVFESAHAMPRLDVRELFPAVPAHPTCPAYPKAGSNSNSNSSRCIVSIVHCSLLSAPFPLCPSPMPTRLSINKKLSTIAGFATSSHSSNLYSNVVSDRRLSMRRSCLIRRGQEGGIQQELSIY